MRTKGSQNKINAEARELFVSNLASQTANVQTAFNELYECDKLKYLEVFQKYASFFLPKLTETKNEIADVDYPIFEIKDAVQFVPTKNNN